MLIYFYLSIYKLFTMVMPMMSFEIELLLKGQSNSLE